MDQSSKEKVNYPPSNLKYCIDMSLQEYTSITWFSMRVLLTCQHKKTLKTHSLTVYIVI